MTLIKREDALKPFCTAPDGTQIPEVNCDNFPVEFSVEFIKKHLLSLPSAEAEWIPVSERLPNEDECGWYLVTVKGWQGLFVDVAPSNDELWKGLVIAWMPLPKPYPESEAEK